jgi:ribosomal protein L2
LQAQRTRRRGRACCAVDHPHGHTALEQATRQREAGGACADDENRAGAR